MTTKNWLVGAALLLSACDNADTAESTSVAAAPAVVAETATTPATAQTSEAPAPNSSLYLGEIVYGDPDAPVEMIEFVSLVCPHCSTFVAQIFPQLDEKYIKTGQLRVVVRSILANRLDFDALAAARCAGPDASPALLKELFVRQSSWMRSRDPKYEIASIARRAGLSRTQLDRCWTDRAGSSALIKAVQSGIEGYNVTGTPNIFINGSKVEIPRFDDIDEAIQKAL